jgi:hypothetical protein
MYDVIHLISNINILYQDEKINSILLFMNRVKIKH